jgi:hypothetical protein
LTWLGTTILEPVRSVHDNPLEALLHVPNVNNVVEEELNSVGRDFHEMVMPQLMASVTSGFDFSSIFFTDGLKRVPVSVYIILVFLSPAFVVGNQVEWKDSPSR